MATSIPSALRDDPGGRENPAGGLNGARGRPEAGSPSPGRAAPGAGGPAAGPWHQPVVWLALALFLASLAGCVLMIVLAMRNPDTAPPAGGDYIMKVPVNRVPVEATHAPRPPASR